MSLRGYWQRSVNSVYGLMAQPGTYTHWLAVDEPERNTFVQACEFTDSQWQLARTLWEVQASAKVVGSRGGQPRCLLCSERLAEAYWRAIHSDV
jgi:hypothetical protein